MEKDRRIIELFLVLIFVALLLIASLIVLTENGKNSSNEVISNSYNTNTYIDYPNIPLREKVVYNYDNSVVYKKIDYKDFDYTSYGEHSRKKDFIGTYIDEFCVYVRNKEQEGNYFKVKFYFEDFFGKEFDESITKYVKTKEKEEFCFRDVQEEKYKYWDWSYKVFPESKNSEKTQVIYVYD